MTKLTQRTDSIVRHSIVRHAGRGIFHGLAAVTAVVALMGTASAQASASTPTSGPHCPGGMGRGMGMGMMGRMQNGMHGRMNMQGMQGMQGHMGMMGGRMGMGGGMMGGMQNSPGSMHGGGMHGGMMHGGMAGGGGMMGGGNRGGMAGGGMHGGGMHGGMAGGRADMGTIHGLLSRTGTITREVNNLPNGIEALTESSDPNVAKLLQEHVTAMKVRLERKQPIRQWDPLFAALFENADKINITVVPTERGVKVVETSDDPYTVQLLQSHAQAVSGFVKDGMAGMHSVHPAPQQ